MTTLKMMLSEITLHDSCLQSVTLQGDGRLELMIDFDEVWNQNLDPKIKGIIFKSIFEIVEYKLDRFNVIGSVIFELLTDYKLSYVVGIVPEQVKPIWIAIEFVAGGSLVLIVEDEVNYLYEDL